MKKVLITFLLMIGIGLFGCYQSPIQSTISSNIYVDNNFNEKYLSGLFIKLDSLSDATRNWTNVIEIYTNLDTKTHTRYTVLRVNNNFNEEDLIIIKGSPTPIQYKIIEGMYKIHKISKDLICLINK